MNSFRQVELDGSRNAYDVAIEFMDKEYSRMAEHGTEVPELSAAQIIDDGITWISVRSKSSLTRIHVPSTDPAVLLTWQRGLARDKKRTHTAVPAYAKFTLGEDFPVHTKSRQRRLGLGTATVRFMERPPIGEMPGKSAQIALEKIQVGDAFSPLNLLSAAVGHLTGEQALPVLSSPSPVHISEVLKIAYR